MNVLTYIQNLTDLNPNAQSAFEVYNTKYPDICAFTYFRTKYNNKRKDEKGLPTITELPNLQHNHSKIELLASNYTGVDLSELISETIPTGTLFDRVISDGGFVRKSVDAVAAKAGSGKTWSRMSLAAKAVIYNRMLIKEQEGSIRILPENGEDDGYREVLPIRAALLSAEMVEHEIAKEVRGSKDLENIDFVYLVNYFRKGVTADQYWNILEQCFKTYDLLIADSFSVIFEQLFELYEGKMKAKKLLFLLIDRLTKWTEKYNCNLQLILQCKRDGTYLGASALVHAISSLCYVHVHGQKRFNMFEKNRNNGLSVNREVFFSKVEGSIEFDEESYRNTYEMVEDTKVSMKDFISELQNRTERKNNEEELKNSISRQTDLISVIAEIEKEESSNSSTVDQMVSGNDIFEPQA